MPPLTLIKCVYHNVPQFMVYLHYAQPGETNSFLLLSNYSVTNERSGGDLQEAGVNEHVILTKNKHKLHYVK